MHEKFLWEALVTDFEPDSLLLFGCTYISSEKATDFPIDSRFAGSKSRLCGASPYGRNRNPPGKGLTVTSITSGFEGRN